MIAVTGANGQLGRLVLKYLVELTDQPLRALVRAPEKAQDLASGQISVVRADYNDPTTLPGSLEGVERLLLISGSEIGNRTAQHAAVINAAKEAGVTFIAYTSLLNAPKSSLVLAAEHIETEQILQQSGIAHVILRNGWYLENFAGTIAAALEHGAVIGASGDGRYSAAAREDYAQAAARTIAGQDLSSRAIELAGQPSLSLSELATELSRQTGWDIPFNNLPEAEYAGILAGAGLPGGFAKAIADADRGASEGELFSSSTALEKLIGHPTKTLSAVISEVLSSAKVA
ncbi:SDR family oxidoreductase [Roseibium sp. SCP14]|uniref:SDR family oxidoreductase n=1 Tax=Roseibium sp. SCP14 TaxID=3141375 RepID=UPI00333A19C7